jgi:hypothetical protein
MADNFFDWFDRVRNDAPKTDVGRLATAAGYTIAHTGGGCLCWEKGLPGGRYLWICDEGNGLGDRLDEPYLVGFYTDEAEIIVDGTMHDFPAALAWCEELITDGGCDD